MANQKTFLERNYRLQKNPFGSRVDLQAPMANRKDVQIIWKRIIEHRRGHEENSLHFIVGDYGLGKSLTLYKIYQDVETESDLLSLYLKFLPEDPISRFGLNLIQRIFKALPNSIKDTELDDSVTENLDRWDPTVGKVLTKFFQGDHLANDYLTGDSTLTASEMRELGIRRKMDTSEKAKDFLIGLLFILHSIGLVSVVLVVDEVEYVFSQMRGARISSVFNTLRDLYDLPQSPGVMEFGGRLANIIYFFGISSAGMRRLTTLERREQQEGGSLVPLLDRQGELIELNPLKEEETKELIELRLSDNRILGTKSQQPLIPYTDEFVSFIYQITGGHPRHIVERCDLVLEDGLREQVPKLNKAFAEKVLEAHGYSIEVN